MEMGDKVLIGSDCVIGLKNSKIKETSSEVYVWRGIYGMERVNDSTEFAFRLFKAGAIIRETWSKVIERIVTVDEFGADSEVIIWMVDDLRIVPDGRASDCGGVWADVVEDDNSLIILFKDSEIIELMALPLS